MDFSRSGRIVNVGRWLFQHRSLGGLTLLPAVLVLREQEREALFWAAGAAVLAVGMAIRVWSIRSIGRSARTRGDKARQLLTAGPYSLCRNPIYIGNLLGFAGMVIAMEAIWYLPIFLVLQFTFYSLIVRYEECLLAGLYGNEFVEYMRTTPRWLPRFSNWKPASILVEWREVLIRERALLLQLEIGVLLVWLRVILMHRHIVIL